MNVLFIADIVGKPGLEITSGLLPDLKHKYRIDCCIANGENGAEGKGLTESIAKQYFSLGIDVITSGNHIWENRPFQDYLALADRVLRPQNYPDGNVGKGYTTVKCADDLTIAVMNLQGRTFMYPINCPFRTASWVIGRVRGETNIIIVDFHAEATAEKSALGWFLDGKVSAVIGTHTHVQTADERILPNGTAYITDVGMTGPFDSVIGMQKDIAIERFLRQTPRKYRIADHNLKFCGAVITIDRTTGKALRIERLQIP
ncbi:TIGR00282 family metallophosphoesterase [candidate division KSB1 bacterium]|nr:TIGR00282 family metallophosphoesterase [candidate division KSB1 bacterium]